MTAVEERAKSELEDAIEDNKPHIPITIKGTKVRKSASVKLPTVKATSTQKTRKRKSSDDEYNIFNKKSRK